MKDFAMTSLRIIPKILARDFLLILFLGSCVAPPKHDTQKIKPGERIIECKGFSIAYRSDLFPSAKCTALPRETQNKESGPPFDVGPARVKFEFKVKRPLPALNKGARYFFPAFAEVWVTPLHDWSVISFGKSYFWLAGQEKLLKELLVKRPADFDKWRNKDHYFLPDEPFNNAAQQIDAKIRFLDVPWGSGVRFLTYYANGITGYGVTNDELCYNFQGITRNGQYYISSRIAVRHSSLPDSIDSPEARSNGEPEEKQAEERKLNRFADKTFSPSLEALDRMMESISFR